MIEHRAVPRQGSPAKTTRTTWSRVVLMRAARTRRRAKPCGAHQHPEYAGACPRASSRADLRPTWLIGKTLKTVFTNLSGRAAGLLGALVFLGNVKGQPQSSAGDDSARAAGDLPRLTWIGIPANLLSSARWTSASSSTAR